MFCLFFSFSIKWIGGPFKNWCNWLVGIWPSTEGRGIKTRQCNNEKILGYAVFFIFFFIFKVFVQIHIFLNFVFLNLFIREGVKQPLLYLKLWNKMFTVNFHILLNSAYNLKALKNVILFFKTQKYIKITVFNKSFCDYIIEVRKKLQPLGRKITQTFKYVGTWNGYSSL